MRCTVGVLIPFGPCLPSRLHCHLSSTGTDLDREALIPGLDSSGFEESLGFGFEVEGLGFTAENVNVELSRTPFTFRTLDLTKDSNKG